MPSNFPSPLAIMGIPSPREIFDEFVNLKRRIETLEKQLEKQETKIERQTKKIERLSTKVTNLKKQVANVKKPRKKRKTKSISPPSTLATKLLQRKKERSERII